MALVQPIWMAPATTRAQASAQASRGPRPTPSQRAAPSAARPAQPTTELM